LEVVLLLKAVKNARDIVILQELRPVSLPSGMDAPLADSPIRRFADSPIQAIDKSVAAVPR
jgi:hypothetical protein